MPTKTEVIEDILAMVEEEFYKTLKAENYPNYFGGRVEITYSAKPRLEIDIHEMGKPGPKKGQKFKPKVGPSKRAIREASSEGFLQ